MLPTRGGDRYDGGCGKTCSATNGPSIMLYSKARGIYSSSSNREAIIVRWSRLRPYYEANTEDPTFSLYMSEVRAFPCSIPILI